MTNSMNKPCTRRRMRRPLHMMAVALMALPICSEAFMPSNLPRRRSAVKLSGSLKEPPSSEFVPVPTRKVGADGRSVRPPSSATPLGAIVDEQKEYEMNLGKAIDTLRSDYPKILTRKPDFSIYHNNLEAVDPSGVTLNGLKNYKYTFRFLHAIINLFYCPERSGLTFRLVHDIARNNIRVSWNAEIVPKAIFGGTRTTLHIDGISVYEVERSSGLITQHRVEHLVINDAAVRPKRGIFYALTNEIIDPDCIPVLNAGGNIRMDFHSLNPLKCLLEPSSTSLFAASTTDETRPGFDNEAFERKNASRKKFGLEPLTPDQFEELEAQVRELDSKQRQRQAAASASTAAELSKNKRKPGFMEKLLGNVLEDTCESNFDCQRPEVCCDFGFKKMCCASGMKVFDGPPRSREGELATIPVVAGYPPGQGPMDDPRNF